MEFQFLCPLGHLLQGDRSQTGQQCKCPYCQTEFLVPSPGDVPQDNVPQDNVPQDNVPQDNVPQDNVPQDNVRQETAAARSERAPAHQPPTSPPQDPPAEVFPAVKVGPAADGAATEAVSKLASPSADQEALLHIPCPKGHVLETPREMLGHDAMCPFCQAQFRLRFEDSREHQRERAEQHARREQKLGRAWMNWAIAAAVVVVFGVIVLIVTAASR